MAELDCGKGEGKGVWECGRTNCSVIWRGSEMCKGCVRRYKGDGVHFSGRACLAFIFERLAARCLKCWGVEIYKPSCSLWITNILHVEIVFFSPRGVVPFSQRKKMLEKARAKNKKPKSSAGISSMPNITVGTQVSDGILWDILIFFLRSLHKID